MKLKLLICILCLFGSNLLESSIHKVLLIRNYKFQYIQNKAVIGTFQIIVEYSKTKFVYTDDFLINVEANRKLDEDVTLVLSEKVKVFIPSKNKIASKNFVKLEEYLYITNY